MDALRTSLWLREEAEAEAGGTGVHGYAQDLATFRTRIKIRKRIRKKIGVVSAGQQ